MQVHYGDRETMLRAVEGIHVLSAVQMSLDKGDFESLWRRRLIKGPATLAVLNPPEPNKNIKPRTDGYLLFDKEKLPAAWERWCTEHKIRPTLHVATTSDVVIFMLMNSTEVKFSRQAAEWYVNMVGCSLYRLELELDKFRYAGVLKVDLDTVVSLIGGSEAVKAENILRALGKPASLRLAQEVDPKRAIPLMAYLSKALEFRKSPYLLALQAVRRGGDRKLFGYWEAVQMFMQYCMRVESGQPVDEVTLELLAVSGVVAWNTA